MNEALIEKQRAMNKSREPYKTYGEYGEFEYQKARRKASRYTNNKELRARVFARDGYKCVYCGTTEKLTVDHIINVYRRGENTFENLQTLCISCNSRKCT